ncbi:hypothetical protein IWQ61_008877 [Dispira simplex]|nr:hypothetical protein IWQ61_008877 [Dispira simplex]
MAHLPRHCKSGSKWTLEDLKSFNIHLVPPVNTPPFSSDGSGTPLLPNVIQECMKNLDVALADYAFQKQHMSTMDNDMAKHQVDDFAMKLFNIGGFGSQGQSIGSGKTLKLTMCGERTEVDVDMHVMDRNGLFVVLQANEIGPEGSHPEVRVIAAAIAAYQYNKARVQELGIVLLDPYVVPCIFMVGTCIGIHYVPVYKWLDDAIRNGTYPQRRVTI